VTIHVLVEGPSEQAFLETWARRLLNGSVVQVHPHQGKGALPEKEGKPDPKNRALLHQLPAKLKAFEEGLHRDRDAVLVLVDADSDEPGDLKKRLEALVSLTPRLRVGIVVAVEETEAFYLGDLRALERAFPDADMESARKYEPDSICGTWELFAKVIHDTGGSKIAWGKAMGPRLTTSPRATRSPSFRNLISALLALKPKSPAAAAKRAFRHGPKNHDEPSRRRR
jgi:Domain of unknown function (DUF4276)